MSISARLDVRQGQGLVMTPQLQQAIKLLQLSNLELQAYIEQELERNPILERVDDGDEFDTPDVEAASADGEAELSFSADAPDMRAEADMDASAQDMDVDADMTVATAVGATVDWSNTGSGGGVDLDGLEDTLTEAVSLSEHLSRQVALSFDDPADRLIASALVEQVDDWGYLRLDMEETASRLGIGTDRLEAVIGVMQSFEPSGICARSVEECLAAQLRDRDRFDPAMQKLVENLHLLARHDLAALCDLCEVDGADLADMIREIRALTPKPGGGFGKVDAISVVPDVFVREGPHGTWLVELNSDTLPKVLVNNAYAETVSRHARTEDERSFVAECHADASWLVRSLDQRARTILKVAREIVRQQDGFLTFGVSHLRPLILKDVATVIEMHESTVSRVTAGKYVATPRGVFELKYFFTASIGSSDGGEAHSAEAVRHQIKSLIDTEQPAKPLSDDRIVEILRESGVDIARRTVAKYREALQIPSSVLRRRQSVGRR
jgi:RNA polymerase sigma-54 factor